MAARIAFLVLCAVLFSGAAFAQEVPEPTTSLVISKETGDCIEVYLDLPCFECELPASWASVDEGPCEGLPGLVDMPSNPIFCSPVQNNACCTEGFFAQGDCTNLVANESEKKCAFVERISGCEPLPENWQSQGLCPPDFEWLGERLECTESKLPSQEAATDGDGLLPALPTIQNPDADQNIKPFELAAIIIVAVAALSFIAYKKLRI